MRHSTLKLPALRWIVTLIALLLVSTACTLSIPEVTGTGGGGNNGYGDGSTPTSVIGEGGGDVGSGSLGTISSGGGGGEGTGDGSGEPNPTLDPQVATALASFGPWKARDLPPFEDGRKLEPYEFTTPERVKVTCSLSDRVIPATQFEEFAAYPFSGTKLPGLIVDGSRIEEADLQVIPLRRSPVPLVVDLASESPSVVVENPDPSSLQGAVSELMRAADARVTGLPVVPANIRFFHREVSSYEEAVLNMGVSLRYKGGGFEGKFKSEFEQSKQAERHTVMARLLQPMFTISVDKSRITEPGDFFNPTTTAGEIDALVAQGRIGADNPPVLIDSVTYGRVVYLTATSEKVASADELKLAVSAAYGGFAGDADLRKKNKEIIDKAEVKIEALGGDEDVAVQALKEGTIQAFMESVNTSTAAPLSMVLRTLDGTKLTVTDEAKVTDIGCKREALPNKVEIQITTGNGTWGTLYVRGTESVTVKDNKSQRVELTDHLLPSGSNEIRVWFRPSFCIGGSMSVSFLLNGQPMGPQWRIEGTAGEWACAETGTWTVDKGRGSVSLVSGPPALREVT